MHPEKSREKDVAPSGVLQSRPGRLATLEELTLGRQVGRLGCRFELEDTVRKLLIDKDFRVLGEAEVARRLQKLLLDRDAGLAVDPQQNLRELAADLLGLGNKLELRRSPPSMVSFPMYLTS